MGIPSYFRKIIQAHPGVLKSSNPVATTLCFDFNCLIYRCIRSSRLPPYDSDTSDMWEKLLLAEVCETVKEVWTTAGKPANVYLAVDGVVPMAKIRQQRVRRFKSAWLAGKVATEAWDTNAITPGTAFMDNLTIELNSMASKLGWKNAVSGVREQGEGEHKIIRYLRGSDDKNVIIYGLDADLILLSMLVAEETGKHIWLLREKQEFGTLVQKSDVQEYCYMDIAMLQQKLYIKDYNSVLNYVALMSLMGNDFLPHSITHKLSEDGHELVLRELRTMTDAWQLVRPATAEGKHTINVSVLKDIAKRWGSDETRRLEQMIQKKQKQANAPLREGTDPMECLPLEWNVESVFLKRGELVEGWRDIYWKFVHPGANQSVKQHACEEYVRGCQWIIDYYTGLPVNMRWVYPYWIPPLWSDLACISDVAEGGAVNSSAPITPEEQLAMVLPLKSWGLVRGELRRVPALIPHMWPRSYTFFSLARKWLWECEARIPVLTAERLREVLKEAK